MYLISLSAIWIISIIFLIIIAIQDYKTTYINNLLQKISIILLFVFNLILFFFFYKNYPEYFLINNWLFISSLVFALLSFFIALIPDFKTKSLEIKDWLILYNWNLIISISDISSVFIFFSFLVLFSFINYKVYFPILFIIIWLCFSLLIIKNKYSRVNYINNIVIYKIKTIEELEKHLFEWNMKLIKWNYEKDFLDSWLNNLFDHHINWKPWHILLSWILIISVIYILSTLFAVF